MKNRTKQDKYSLLDRLAKLSDPESVDRSKCADLSDSELAELAAMAKRIKQKYIEGKIKDAPRTYLGCRDWETAILYSFQRGWLAPNNFIKKTGDKITDVSWAGLDFNDKIVVALEKIAGRIGVNNDLKELRLFSTGFSQDGLKKLQAIFPSAKITLFDKKQEDENPKLFWIGRHDV